MRLKILVFFVIFCCLPCISAYPFWIWNPKTKKIQGGKSSVKPTPKEQFLFAKSFFDEENYDLYVVASSSSQYGREMIDVLTVAHIITVEKPEVSLNEDSTGMWVSVNASYTQLNGWIAFTENVQTMILLYDETGTTVNSFSISYNPGTNAWGMAYVDLSTVKGEHYVKVSFRYADRTVRSVESDHFIAEGVPTSPPNTGFLDFSPWLIVALAMFAVSLPIIVRKLRK